MIPEIPRTIAAIATPPGSGALGVIRISGPDAIAIAGGLVRVPSGAALETRPSRKLFLVRVHDPATGGTLDRGQAAIMRAPSSATGEDVVELYLHGGWVLLTRVLRLILERGAHLAGPGEFTRRAFENGKIDLTQAEAVIDVINKGKTKMVTFRDFSNVTFAARTSLKVAVKPVTGETNTANNTAEYPVIFTL